MPYVKPHTRKGTKGVRGHSRKSTQTSGAPSRTNESFTISELRRLYTEGIRKDREGIKDPFSEYNQYKKDFFLYEVKSQYTRDVKLVGFKDKRDHMSVHAVTNSGDTLYVMPYGMARLKSLLKVRNKYNAYSWDLGSGSPRKNSKAIKYYPMM